MHCRAVSSLRSALSAVRSALSLPRFWLVAGLVVLVLYAGPALAATAADPSVSLSQILDDAFRRWLVRPVAALFFFDLIFWDNTAAQNRELPFIVAWLFTGAVFFTLRLRFINIRAFAHAIQVVRGRFDDPRDKGEVSHFQALSSALSATVGLGNIGGVAVAIGTGGPGAIFWMWVAAFVGMSAKFAECTLGQMYRRVDARGHISGGPMRYLAEGLRQRGDGWARLGQPLARLFAVLCIGASLGSGNMFQANQSYAQVAHVLPALQGTEGAIVYGLCVAVAVAMVTFGGMRRIGKVAAYLVPAMCLVYLLAGLWVLLVHAGAVPAAFAGIVAQAFRPEAQFGGALGVMVTGIRRAAFSNEAGAGSSAIAHAAAATAEPVREGIVALLEPFIDTIVVCTVTALVVTVTGAYRSPAEGVLMTSGAFGSVLPWFPTLLSVATFFFAFSTMLSWSYYGERCWSALFGPEWAHLYRGLFLVFIVLGSLLPLSSVIDFADLMMLGMALANMTGLYLLARPLDAALRSYWRRLQTGGFAPAALAPERLPAARSEH
ncbi:MAG: alanine/glycine:cation symporter family protein [Polyangiales bacterium]